MRFLTFYFCVCLKISVINSFTHTHTHTHKAEREKRGYMGWECRGNNYLSKDLKELRAKALELILGQDIPGGGKSSYSDPEVEVGL